MGRILGIDHGDARIGIAMSDETEFLASPLATVQNGKGAVDEIVSISFTNVKDKSCQLTAIAESP